MTILSKFEPKWVQGRVFIETGTGGGWTLLNAAEAGFRDLWSIEFDEMAYEYNREKFKDLPHVHLLHGDSRDMLARVVQRTVPTTFWLDAHFSGGSFWYDERHEGRHQCPLLAELNVILAQDWETPPVILIDDWVLFLPWEQERYDQGFRREEWPYLPDVVAPLARAGANVDLRSGGIMVATWPE